MNQLSSRATYNGRNFIWSWLTCQIYSTMHRICSGSSSCLS